MYRPENINSNSVHGRQKELFLHSLKHLTLQSPQSVLTCGKVLSARHWASKGESHQFKSQRLNFYPRFLSDVNKISEYAADNKLDWFCETKRCYRCKMESKCDTQFKSHFGWRTQRSGARCLAGMFACGEFACFDFSNRIRIKSWLHITDAQVNTLK